MDFKDTHDPDFDFEKEYGFDPSLMDSNYDDDMDLDAALAGLGLNFDEEPAPVEEAPAEIPVEMPAEAPVEEPVAEAPVYHESFKMPEPFEMPDYDETEEISSIFAEEEPPVPAYPVDDAALNEYPQEAEEPAPAPAKPKRRKGLSFGKKKTRRPNPLRAQEAPAPAPEQEVFFDEAPAQQPAPEAAEMPAVETAAMDAPVQEAPAQETPAQRPQRQRRKKTKEQIFKEVYLPPIIAGVAAVLILFMVIGSIVRAVNNGRTMSDLEKEQAAAQAQLDAEAETLMAQAADLAAGYDYAGAIALLDTFSGEMSAYPEMLSARSEYVQTQSQLIEWKDPSNIPNLSFHVLIADPARAFTDETYGKNYNRNFVTVEEFKQILQQLYDNGYVLVDLDDVVYATTADGKTTYTANTIYLPDGKKPIMITETMVNYFAYMIDSDGDGAADAGGDGFASRLVLDDNGEIKAEMVTSSGETVVGNYDLVPILNDFIAEHPDFSYRGARAILAVTGHEGLFGYRTNTGNADEIAGATAIVEALRADGYTIACYTYNNENYQNFSATQIQADLQKWTAQVTPILGEVDVLVFARGVDINDYTGNQYNVLYNAGFRYFIGASTTPYGQVTGNYFHQKRIMVTGTQMAYGSNVFSSYFNSLGVLDATRGNVPN